MNAYSKTKIYTTATTPKRECARFWNNMCSRFGNNKNGNKQIQATEKVYSKRYSNLPPLQSNESLINQNGTILEICSLYELFISVFLI